MGTIPELSECSPGIAPVEYNVLIIQEIVEERTAGGIWKPEKVQDTDQAAQQRGRLVAASPLAFNYDNYPVDGVKPQVGDLIWFAKYSGSKIEGKDGKTYILTKDKDIGAVVLD